MQILDSASWRLTIRASTSSACSKRRDCESVKICVCAYVISINLGVMKGQTLLPSLHWICRVPRLVYPIMILNTVSTNILFPLRKMIGMVRLRPSFILSSQSWEIGNTPTGGAGRIKLSCVVTEI